MLQDLLNPDIVAHLRTFTIFGIPFHAYGLIIGLSIIVATALFIFNLPEKKKSQINLPGLLLFVIPAGVAGGRIGFILVNLPLYFEHPLNMLSIWNGGITIFGVIAGGFLGYAAYWMFILKRKLPFLYIPDLAAPSLALAQTIGRWGNFINQELYGSETNLPWGMPIDSHTYHPAFLYESILDFMNFVILTILVRKSLKKHLGTGIIFGLYLIFYGSIRIVLERIRIDSSAVIGELKYADFASIIFILLGTSILIYGIRRKKSLTN